MKKKTGDTPSATLTASARRINVRIVSLIYIYDIVAHN